ncbi:MAG: BatA and WFA domain-containing protein [Anaerolineae bacterium]|nr:BatA and WFA domain-containing protein [Anaerolineae bacterium]
MSFLTPLALALGVLAGPIILMYMLRLRRREVQVSSTLLWQQLLRDREANAPWQKLRRNLLLLLQLLILAALIFALARPFMEVPAVTTGRIALLIDASASMNTTDVEPSRFEVAKQQALSMVDTLSQQDSLALIRVAEQPEVVENYSADQTRLRNAINGMQPSQGSPDWNAALTLAAAGASGAEKFTIVIVSDGGLPGGLPANVGNIKFIPVGKSDSNLAISALAVASDAANGPQLYARITNYGSQNTDVVFSIKLDDNLFNANNYTVPASGYYDVVVPSLPATFRRVEASLTHPASSNVPDYLALDDTAWTVFNPATAGRALILTKQNRFIEQGFASMPDWQTFRGDVTKGLPADPFDLYVFDSWLPPTLPNGNMLIINPPSDTPLFKLGAVSSDLGNNLMVKPDDPRTRFLKFNDVNIRQFRLLTDTPWADTLVSAQGGPLVLAGQYNDHRVAVIAFDLHDSDLALKIAWPILLSDLTEWYKAPRAIRVNGSLQPGQTVTIQPGVESDKVRVHRPDGATTTLNVDQPLLIYADTAVPGIYQVEVFKGDQKLQDEQFAVNLFDSGESHITPQTPKFSNANTSGAAKEEIGQREFWPWLALLALIVLALEWYVHHRRLRVPGLRVSPLKRLRRA